MFLFLTYPVPVSDLFLTYLAFRLPCVFLFLAYSVPISGLFLTCLAFGLLCVLRRPCVSKKEVGRGGPFQYLFFRSLALSKKEVGRVGPFRPRLVSLPSLTKREVRFGVCRSSWNGRDRVGRDRTGQDRAGQDRTGQDGFLAYFWSIWRSGCFACSYF